LGRSNASNVGSHVTEFEFQVPEENILLKNLIEIFQPTRKLRPKIVKAKKKTVDEVKQCTITIQIMKGVNIPARIKSNNQRMGALNTMNFQASNLESRLSHNRMNPQMHPGQSNYNNYNSGYGTPNQNQQGMMSNWQTQQRRGDPRDNMLNPNYGSQNYGNQYGSQYPNTGFRSQMNNPNDPFRNGQMDGYGNMPGTNMKEKDYDDPQTFVKVRLTDDKREIFASTECSDGIDPEWNESLVIPYFSHDPKKQQFTVNELIKNDGHLFINVFDFLGEYGERPELPGEISIAINRKYIGSVDIPLYTVFENPKMNGMFRLNRPLFLFGYLSKKANIWSDVAKGNSLDLEDIVIFLFLNGKDA
jgi:hypothetical protein